MSAYKVWFRTADKTLNCETIKARDIVDVYRVFEGIEIISIEKVSHSQSITI